MRKNLINVLWGEMFSSKQELTRFNLSTGLYFFKRDTKSAKGFAHAVQNNLFKQVTQPLSKFDSVSMIYDLTAFAGEISDFINMNRDEKISFFYVCPDTEIIIYTPHNETLPDFLTFVDFDWENLAQYGRLDG